MIRGGNRPEGTAWVRVAASAPTHSQRCLFTDIICLTSRLTPQRREPPPITAITAALSQPPPLPGFSHHHHHHYQPPPPPPPQTTINHHKPSLSTTNTPPPQSLTMPRLRHSTPRRQSNFSSPAKTAQIPLNDDTAEKAKRHKRRTILQDMQMNKIAAAAVTPGRRVTIGGEDRGESPVNTPLRGGVAGDGPSDAVTPLRKVPILANFEEWMKLATDNVRLPCFCRSMSCPVDCPMDCLECPPH